MKTKVTLSQDLIKTYYHDLFMRETLFILILVFLVGSITAGTYIVKDKVWVGIALEVVTLFTSYILFMMNHNQRKVAINELALSVRDYYFEFSSSSMKVSVHKEETIVPYTKLQASRTSHFYRFKIKGEKDHKIYIIPTNNFTLDEWSAIIAYIKEENKKETK